MMHSRLVEITVGAFIAIGLAALFMLAMKVSNLSDFGGSGGYQLQARFSNIGGLKVRAPVTVAGVLVGRVSGISLDGETYEALVTLDMDVSKAPLQEYNEAGVGSPCKKNSICTSPFPEDTSASIMTSGLLGEQYVGLEPGGAPDYLMPGDTMLLTQSSISLEQIIGQFLFSKSSEEPSAAQ